tara:strand:- start:2175 stop:2507 length:333 start_codon:yes stop_codon:yes gene_type:complete
MSFRLTGRLTTDLLPTDADTNFDVTYSEDDGWSDPTAPILLFVKGTRFDVGPIYWQPIPQGGGLWTEPTVTGTETQVASTVGAVLQYHDVVFDMVFSEPAQAVDPEFGVN